MADSDWVEGHELSAPGETAPLWVEGHELDGPARHALEASATGPGKIEALLHGAGQGATLGFGDEINGGIQGLYDWATNPNSHGLSGLAEQYRHNRDAFRREDAAAEAAHPGYYGGAELLASIPTTFLPGLNIGKGAKALEAVGKSALAGGLAGYGGSEGKTAGEDAISTLVGMGLGGLFGVAGRRFGRVAERATEGVRDATADMAQLLDKGAKKVTRRATAALGGESAAALGELERLTKIANAQPGHGLTPEIIAAAKARLDDPEFHGLVQNAAENLVQSTRNKGSLLTARNVLEAAKAAETPEAIEAATTEAMAHPIKTQVLPRLKTYATRAVPLAVGTSIGGPAGAVAGMATGAALGAPGTSMANMIKNPAMRGLAWELLGGGANALQPVASRSAGAASLKLSPDVAGMIAALRKPKGPDYSSWTPEAQ